MNNLKSYDVPRRLLLEGYNIHREAVLPENMETVDIGTGRAYTIRFREKDFPEPFYLCIKRVGEVWRIECGENLYLSSAAAHQAVSVKLRMEETATVSYRSSGAEIFHFRILYDHALENRKYDRCLQIRSLRKISANSTDGAEIRFGRRALPSGGFILLRKNGEWKIERETGELPVYLNGCELTGSRFLKEMDFIDAGPYGFCFQGNALFTESNSDLFVRGMSIEDKPESRSVLAYPKFNRSTRIHHSLPEEDIEILDPPSLPTEPSTDLAMHLLPAVGMFGFVLLMRATGSGGIAYLAMSGMSMGVGVATSVYSMIRGKKNYRKKLEERETAYRGYIEKKDREITEAREEELRLLEEIHHTPERELGMIEWFDRSLFEKQPEDADFLEIRIGRGERKAARATKYKKQERIYAADQLELLPELLSREKQTLKDAPITLRLRENSTTGIIGKRSSLADYLAMLTLDLVSRHYHTDVRLFYCLSEEDLEQFSYIKYLPHVQNDALRRRNIICDEESKTILFDYLYKLLISRSREDNSAWIVVFLYRDYGIRNHPISELMRFANELGISFLYFDEYEENLPSCCTTVIGLEDGNRGTCTDTGNGEMIPFRYTYPEREAIKAACKKLEPVYCEEINLESALTRNITFFDMMHILDPEDLDLERTWTVSDVCTGMAVPLGVKTKNQTVYLDIHEKAHGPHGLVAGTTGSGKSELLQSYILSLAIHFHPYEVGFVIIDFKGGGMVNQFRDLPHLVGAITNIDTNAIDRSLLSIRAELKKRQELFAEHGVNHIDQYIRLYKRHEARVPLPHLILIVDEFAELKVDQPDFMKELISTARIGRSLGVHLILSTQKPSGVVDPQIWSNSRFKLCLKVQSREDSNEVLKTPLAAEIKEPGRAYLQVGNNEVFELFQSAYSGAPALNSEREHGKLFSIDAVDFAGRHKTVYSRKKSTGKEDSLSQLQSIVRYVAEVFQNMGLNRLPMICLEPLPQLLDFPEILPAVSCARGLVVAIGLFDDPSNQYQGEFILNVTQENTIIIGSSGYGKSNLLQTILRGLTTRYSPEQLNLYILDFGSMVFRNYDDLAHVGGVVCSFEDEKLKNFFKQMQEEIARRKETLVSSGISSYAAYLEAGLSGMPQIVIMVDNLTALKDMYLTDEDPFLHICREGLAVGISVIVANAQTSWIGFRYLSNFGQRIALYCNDSTEYSALFDTGRRQPAAVPGRGIVLRDKELYELQAYLSFSGEKEVDRVERIKEYVSDRNACSEGKRASRIPVVPDKVTRGVAKRDFGASSSPEKILLGIDFDTVAPSYLSIRETGLLCISGKEEYGKNAFVRYMAEEINRQGGMLFVYDSSASTLAYTAELPCISYYASSEDDLEEMFAELRMHLDARLKQGAGHGQNQEKPDPPIFVMLHSAEVLTRISEKKDLLDTFKAFSGRYAGLNACMICTDLENAPISFNAPETLKILKSSARLLLFENLKLLKLIDITLSMQKKYAKVLGEGEAYYLAEQQLSKIKTVQEVTAK